MDFTFTTEQDDAAELATSILRARATPQRLREVEKQGSRLDTDLWRELGTTGLLSLAIPEEHGGSGLGLLELCRVLVEVGRTVAPVPLAVHGACALALTRHGSAEQQSAWLPGAAGGELLISAAVAEERSHLPVRPTVTARGSVADGWSLEGSKSIVRAGTAADLLLVTASIDGSTEGPDVRELSAAVFLVRPDAEGVTVVAQRTSDGDTVARVDLAGARGELLAGSTDADATREVADDLGRLLTVCAAAEQLGVTEGALRLTSDYASTREQFGRAIGTFQAVSQRLADGYIDVLAQRLTLWQAAWRVAEGLPCETEVAAAKLWAADAGHRLAHTTVHVHGGVGIDLDGEAHRYFTSAKRFEFHFGAATEQALRIGRVLASEPA